MSLRAFHIVFLISVFSLFIFLCYWNYVNWKIIGGSTSLVYMFMSLISGVAIIFYGTKFYKRTKVLDG